MTHPLPERFSDYLDGELPASEARALEAHLDGCTACQTLLAELRRVVARAQALEDQPPHADLWPGVAAAIGASPGRRRVSLSVPQLLAAGIGLMVLSGGTVAAAWKWWPRPMGERPAVLAPAAATPGIAAESVVSDRGYEAAIRELESQVVAGRGRLDTTTVRVVEEKLKLIDRAILEAERALAADPSNVYLSTHLTETRLRKLDLLRRASALAHVVS
ncbi:MAG TPA: zf-HC2 domain-containing protein [Gemmatimonadales bacterium]|nr:zf-HC2 domain-containing protein [Gemmatimonadales bacterium]